MFLNVNISRYEPQIDGIDESRRKQEVKKINFELLKKLQEFDTEITFSTGRYKYACGGVKKQTKKKTCLYRLWSFFPGPEFTVENDDCIFVGMVTEDVDVTELVNTIGAIGRDIEESGRVTIARIL